jgi:autotransporter-associated beta strand protein
MIKVANMKKPALKTHHNPIHPDLTRTRSARWLRLLCVCALLPGWLVTRTQAAIEYVIVISVDGLGGTYLGKLFDGTATGGPYAIPNFTRLKNEGAGTLAAHCDNNNWETLPNHTSIITGRPRDGVNGHNWTGNGDPTMTIHANKGLPGGPVYVASGFDVAHDNGQRTGMYANKSKFMLFDTYASYTGGGSYNANNGAPDTTGANNGRDKIDNSYINTALGGIVVDTFITQQKSASPNQFAFLHINEPDAYGHSSDWGTATWNSQVVVVDTMLGKIFKLIEQDVPAMTGKTAIVLTADHGNQDDPPTGADRYAVPFYVWGPGVSAGANLYTLNAGTRQVAASYPMTTYEGMQPIRNAEASNLALGLLGMGAIPGSTFNSTQNLKVATTSNAAPNIPATIAPSNGATSVSTNATTTVAVADPNNDPMAVSFYGRAYTPPPGPDFTVVVLPDTQFYSASYPATFQAQTNWIVNNRVARNIVYVTGEGDVVDSANTTQYDVATAAYAILENPVTTGLAQGIPFGVPVGNHDSSPYTLFKTYFPTTRFSGRSYYGGSYSTGYQNHYDLINASGLDFIVLSLEFNAGANPAIMTWANGILAANASRRAIVVTHSLLNAGYNWPADAAWSGEGPAIFNGLSANPNLFLMLCGHNHGQGRRHEAVGGRYIDVLLADYQSDANGGDGYLRTLEFSPANNVIRVKTYSPTTGGSKTTADNEFTLNYTMSSTPSAYTLIGTNTGVASGTQTSRSWSGLTAGTAYEWYAVASDGSLSATAASNQFTTAGVAPQLPTVALGITGNPMAEAAGVATVTATLSATSTSTVTVNLAFAGTATLTNDYARSNTSISIPAGSLTGSITLTAVQDALYEYPDETIVVDIDTVVNATENGTQQVTATITNDDPAPTGGFTAYNDCTASAGNPANTTLYRGQPDGSGFMKDFTTGLNTPVTLTVASAGLTYVGTGGPMPDVGTDCYNVFNGKVVFNNVAYYGTWMEARFTGLDPNKEYEFVTSVNRGNAVYTTRTTQFTISGADSATQASSTTPAPGVTVNSPTQVTFCTGANQITGYVARWTQIKCGADGAFTVRTDNADGQANGYAMDGIMLKETIPTASPATSGTSGSWHDTATWDTGMVPTSTSPVIVNNSYAVTITTAAAECNSLTLSGGGSISSTGRALTVSGTTIDAMNTTGCTLALNATSTLNIAKANTSASLAGLTVGSGTILNVTSELTVDVSKNLSGATLNTPKVTLAGGTLTIGAVTVPSGGLISGTGAVAGAVTVVGGGKVSPGASVGSFSVDGLTLSAGSLLNFEFNTTPANDQITVGTSGGLTINGGAISLYNEGGTTTFSTAGTYNLFAYSGSIGGNVSNLSVANKVAGKSYTFGATGTYVTLTIAQGAAWNGGGTTADWSEALNWTNVSPSTGDILPFVTTGAGGAVLNNNIGGSYASLQFESGAPAFTLNGNAVTLTGDVSGNVVLNNSTNTQTVNMPVTLGNNGAINTASNPVVFGSAGTINNNGNILTITGTQPVTLNGAMTGIGGVTMAASAKLNLANDAAVSGTLTINAGGTLDNTKGSLLTLTNNPAHVWAGDFTFTGTQDLNLGTGAVTITKATADESVTVNGGASRTLTIGGAVTMAAQRLVKKGNGTLVISSASSNIQRLQVTGGGTLRLDNSVAGTPDMTVTSESVRVNDNNSVFDINNFALTTPGMDIDKGRIVARGTSVITNTGGNRITESADSNCKSFRFMDTAVINGGTGNLETSWTQAAQSVYITFQNSAQGSFNNILFGPNAEYADSTGHNTVLEVRDTAQLSTTLDMYVMQRINDQNRDNAGGARVHMQVYQHGGTVSVGRDLRLCDNDPVKGALTVKHEVDGAYNLWTGSSLKVGGRVTGGQTRVGVGQSYFNFHGGTLTYTGAGPQTDWINLTASTITDAIDSTKNLRVWEGATIDTGTQDLTVAQALLGPTGDGVSAIDITGLTGTVYSNDCPPWVFITRDTAGGDTTGSGASAVPTINAAGNITGFTITNPGNNYTQKPLITLIRGDLGTPGTVPAANITMAANSTYTGGLTKQGTSKLTLTGTNTYTGDTVVQNGILSLSPTVAGGYLADGADVKLTTGAVLDLNTSVTDTIRSLYIDNVQKASGIWGALLSGAAHESALITGSGKLNVLTGAAGYASWAGANGISLNPSEDTNNDGVANGVAYFMNVTGLATNPGINGITKQVTWPNGGNINSDQYGIQFVVQTSSDLQTWTDIVGTGPSPDPNLSNQSGSVSYTLTLTDPSPRFVRLKVTPN